MKIILIGLSLLSSVSTFASTYQDRVTCSITAKVGSESTRIKELPKTLTISMDVLAEGLRTDVLGFEKRLYQEEWTGYSYSMVQQPINKEIDDLICISSLRKYTTNNVYMNHSGIHNNRVKEFKVKLKSIRKDEVKVLSELS